MNEILDLIQRLRVPVDNDDSLDEEAADLFEALQAERDQWKAEYVEQVRLHNLTLDDVQRYYAALELIASNSNRTEPAYVVAREALGETE